MGSKLIKVTLLRSGINKLQGQKDTLRGLGLTKLRKTVYLENTSAARGMIRKVQHLVEVAVATQEEQAALDSFLELYPTSVYTQNVRAMREALAGGR